MKKITAAVVLLLSILLGTFAQASMLLEYDGGIHNYTGAVYKLKINGTELTDLPLEPIIFNDRAVVPVREVFESLGALVDYNAKDKSIKITYDSKVVELKIGSYIAKVDGDKQAIPDYIVPRLIAKWGESAKTMVPARFISENVGLSVGFDQKAGIISISEKSTRPTANPTSTPTPTKAPDDENLTNTLNRISFEEEDGVVTVRVSAKSEIEKISKASMTAAGVIYVDVYGANYSIDNKTEVNFENVLAVRLGQHEESARIAIDTKDVKKYSVALSGDKKSVVFKISGDKNADLGTPEPTTTQKPSQSPSASQSPAPSQSPTPKPIVYSEKKIVVIDAGHGGSDPGAVAYKMTEEEKALYYEALDSTEPVLSDMKHGSGDMYKEKDIALSVARKVRENLEDNGITVIMTRTGDTYPTLEARPELANSKGAVIFVSIHLNSTTSEVTAAKGVEVYYSKQNNDNTLSVTSEGLADKILDGIVDFTDANSRGVKSGNLLVNRKCMMPSALVELGFMNNPDELELLITEKYQDKLAAGIAKGIISTWEDVKIPKK